MKTETVKTETVLDDWIPQELKEFQMPEFQIPKGLKEFQMPKELTEFLMPKQLTECNISSETKQFFAGGLCFPVVFETDQQELNSENANVVSEDQRDENVVSEDQRDASDIHALDVEELTRSINQRVVNSEARATTAETQSSLAEEQITRLKSENKKLKDLSGARRKVIDKKDADIMKLKELVAKLTREKLTAEHMYKTASGEVSELQRKHREIKGALDGGMFDWNTDVEESKSDAPEKQLPMVVAEEQELKVETEEQELKVDAEEQEPKDQSEGEENGLLDAAFGWTIPK